jgi:hypothetical protein
MARKTTPAAPPEGAPAPEDPPVALKEPGPSGPPPGAAPPTYGQPESPWGRGLAMLIVAVAFWVAQWLLGLAAVVQFLWLLFAKEKNPQIAAFGTGLSRWMAEAAAFLTAASEEKPFPFKAL